MDANEFRDLMERLGMTQGDVARLLGRDFALVRRWASGKKAIPPEAEQELRALLAQADRQGGEGKNAGP
jgi:DNA-binding transcriptional regulator YiaG